MDVFAFVLTQLTQIEHVRNEVYGFITFMHIKGKNLENTLNTRILWQEYNTEYNKAYFDNHLNKFIG